MRGEECLGQEGIEGVQTSLLVLISSLLGISEVCERFWKECKEPGELCVFVCMWRRFKRTGSRGFNSVSHRSQIFIGEGVGRDKGGPRDADIFDVYLIDIFDLMVDSEGVLAHLASLEYFRLTE